MTLEQLQSFDTYINDVEPDPAPQFCVCWDAWFLMDDGTFECVPCSQPINPSDELAWATLPGLTGFTGA